MRRRAVLAGASVGLAAVALAAGAVSGPRGAGAPAKSVCPLPAGSWATRASDWPVDFVEVGTARYASTELVRLLRARRLGGTDASIALSVELVAAKLNVANGASREPVDRQVAGADALLAKFSGPLPYHVSPTSSAGRTMGRRTAALSRYNRDALTPRCVPFSIGVRVGGLFRPLGFTLLGGRQAVVRIKGRAPRGFRVFVASAPGKPGTEVTPAFSKVAGGTWRARVPLLPGSTSLRVTGPSGRGAVFTATAVTYGAGGSSGGTSSVQSIGGPDEFRRLPGTTVLYSTRTINLDFVDTASDSEISAFLQSNGLRPLEVLVDPTRAGRPKLLTVGVPSGVDALRLVKRLNELPTDRFPFFPATSAPVSPPLEVAVPIFATPPPDVAGEALPERLRLGAAAPTSPGNAGDGYDPETGGFDNDDDGLAAGADFDELDISWTHFTMDTFAAHGLVERLTAHAVPVARPLVASIDTGLGDGTGTALVDIPAARLVQPTDCTVAGCPVVGLAAIPDQWATGGAAGDHGTAVAHVLAGAGNRILGTGKHVALRPMKAAGNMTAGPYVQGLQTAAADPAVQVVLLEYQAPSFDMNGDGQVTGAELVPAVNVLNGMRVTWLPGINALLAPNPTRILVVPAGNMGHDSSYSLLAGSLPAAGAVPALNGLFDAPIRGSRALGAANSLVVGVGNSSVQRPPLGEQLRAQTSNFGTRISVTANGGDFGPADNRVPSLRPNQTFRRFGGTSHAAPVVAGLIGDLLYLDRNSAEVGPLTPLAVVELVEATADDLGTRHAAAPFLNDAPGNGPDNDFGFGRVNAWKATLSAASGGLAAESAPAAGFTLPRLDAAHTRWYGFKIITYVKGATVWVDGRKLVEGAAIVPDPEGRRRGAATKTISAYAGVRSDEPVRNGVRREDPTSGVVPLGNRGGEHAITFSIRAQCTRPQDEPCLVGPTGERRTLSLRLPRQDAGDSPFFNLDLDLQRLRSGDVPGVRFDDFVFEVTPSDFEDRGGGALGSTWHENTSLEWLGKPESATFQSVTPEQALSDPVDPDGVPNAVDRDRYDNGVLFYVLTFKPRQRGMAEFTACTADPASGRYGNDPDRSLWVNGWIDWNTNGSFEAGGGEHVVNGVQLNPAAAWAVVAPNPGVRLKAIGTSRRCATFSAEFPVPAKIGQGDLWARFRVDYGENAGGNDPRPLFESLPNLQGATGPARFGEVEDYRLGSDFGDVRAPVRRVSRAGDRGSYPALRAEDGARHLDTTREWLGTAVTREPDACLKPSEQTADQDGASNLSGGKPGCEGANSDGADEATVALADGSKALTVAFSATSSISSYGYDLGGGAGKKTTSVQSLAADCKVKGFDLPPTPRSSAGKGRYQSVAVDDDRDGKLDEDRLDGADNDRDGRIDEDPPGLRTLVANVWVDWDGDGAWSSGSEWVLRDARIAPETFGQDSQYTLGEPFGDRNGNGVRDGVEPFTDVAGAASRSVSCTFPLPSGAGPKKVGSVRIRLAYAEQSDGTIPGSGGARAERLLAAGLAHATEERRKLDRDRGGALFGEVEDYGPPGQGGGVVVIA